MITKKRLHTILRARRMWAFKPKPAPAPLKMHWVLNLKTGELIA